MDRGVGKGAKMSQTEFSRQKDNFRQKKCWKEFKKKLFKERKRDALTGSKLNGTWNCHHMRIAKDIEEYSDLEEQSFQCLNSLSHSVLHFCAHYAQRDPHFMERLNRLVEEMVEENQGREIPMRGR